MKRYTIAREGTTFEIANFPWKKDFPFAPKTTVTVSYDDDAIKYHLVSYETNLRAVETAHNTPVCQDSCMEVFMQYAPATDERYINLEINPNGAVYNAVRYDRARSQKIDPADVDMLGVKTAIYDDRWELDLTVPKEYIQKHIPTYRHGKGNVIRGNFYKCGDLTGHPHYGCFSNIEWAAPDYHRPEFFAEFELV
jgi:hypothetical protein